MTTNIIRAQQILASYGVTESSSQGIKEQANSLEPKTRQELTDEIASALLGVSYRIGTAADEGRKDRDSHGQGMALISLLELLEPNHPLVGSK